MFGAFGSAYFTYMKSKACKHKTKPHPDGGRKCTKCGAILIESTDDFVKSVKAQLRRKRKQK